jgi:membrane-associated phospholipid phosphatase
VRVKYAVRADRAIGGGTTPTLRLQRALGTPGAFRVWEKLLIWSHWLWFTFPHGTAVYLLLRHPERFERGAARIYATFDLGLLGYWGVPTAPPWYAAAEGHMEDGLTPDLRRMMVEYGEQFWKSGWAPLYGVLGGNPLAAMPSLHFATSVTAAHVLAETGSVAGAFGWTYALLLGVALVYLGVHYVVDLAAGLALAETVHRGAPVAAPAARRFSTAVRVIEAQARG